MFKVVTESVLGEVNKQKGEFWDIFATLTLYKDNYMV